MSGVTCCAGRHTCSTMPIGLIEVHGGATTRRTATTRRSWPGLCVIIVLMVVAGGSRVAINVVLRVLPLLWCIATVATSSRMMPRPLSCAQVVIVYDTVHFSFLPALWHITMRRPHATNCAHRGRQCRRRLRACVCIVSRRCPCPLRVTCKHSLALSKPSLTNVFNVRTLTILTCGSQLCTLISFRVAWRPPR